MRPRILSGAAALAILLLSASTDAQQIQFFAEDIATFGQSNDRLSSWPSSDAEFADFLANLTVGVGTEDFEGFADGATNPTLTFPGAGTATLTGGGSVDVLSSTTVSNSGAYGSSGTAYYLVNTSDAFTIDFSGPTAAFGFFATDVGDFGGQLLLEFVHSDATSTHVTVPHTTTEDGDKSGSMLFYGLIDKDSPFESVYFTADNGPEGFGFDDMTIASVEQVDIVPEPAGLLLLGTGLLGLGAVAVRRRRDAEPLE